MSDWYGPPVKRLTATSEQNWQITARQLVERRLAAEPERLAGLLAEVEAEAWQAVRERLREAMMAAILEALDSAASAPEAAQASQELIQPAEASRPPADSAPAPSSNGHHLEPPAEAATQSITPASGQARPTGPAEATPTGVYVYGIVASNEKLELPGSGLGGPYLVLLQPYRDLAAVVSPVPLSEFGQEAIEANLADMAWLEARVRGHQAILDAILPQVTLIPMKFATIYHSPAGVEKLLAARYDDFIALLDRLRDRSELGVKLYVAPATLSEHIAELSPEVQRLQAELTSKPQGAAYFTARKLQELTEQETEQLSFEVADSTHEQLTALAHAAALSPLQGPEITGPDETMVLNAVYLVDHAAQEEFQGALDGQAQAWSPKGFRFELSGPWPAYNFVSLEGEASGDAHG